MKRIPFYLTIAGVLLVLFLDSCHSSRRAARRARRFNEQLTLSGGRKPSAPPKRPPVRPAAPANTNGTRPLSPDALRKKYAGIIGLSPKQIQNIRLYQFIDSWYGVSYRLGGQDGRGIDCSGFAQKLYGAVYGRDLVRTAMEQFTSCKRFMKTAEAREGDLVFFAIQSKRITHVGVYLANNYFVHASTSGGVMISSLNEDYWRKYYAGCGRLPQG